MRNSQYYSDPVTFNPERFIATSDREAEQDPAKLVFGFGRRYAINNSTSRDEQALIYPNHRICPGKDSISAP